MNKSPIGWALMPLKRYAEFSGRSSRAEMWWFMLLLFVVFMVIWFTLIGSLGALIAAGTTPTDGSLQAMGGGILLMGLLSIAILIPTIAVQVRRLHDTGRSGWWLGGYYLLYALYMGMAFTSVMSAAVDPSSAAEPSMGAFGLTMILGLALFIYMIVLLVFYVLPGTRGENRYGPDPYGEDIEQVFA